MGNKFTLVCWPDTQDLMTKVGFSDNAFPVNDDVRLEMFGFSAYFVSDDWLASVS